MTVQTLIILNATIGTAVFAGIVGLLAGAIQLDRPHELVVHPLLEAELDRLAA